jgi:hypothetical protein
MPRSVQSVTDQDPAVDPGRGRGPLERVTVNLTPRSSRALDHTVAMTGESKTDTINRAVQVYELVEEIMKAGGALYIRPHAEAELERLRIF